MSTINSVSAAGMMMPQAMSGASMRMPPHQKMSNLFAKIDTAGTGSISKAQFVQAFNTMNPPAAFKALGADNAFAKLDSNGNGQVTKQEFIDGMKSLMTFGHQRHAATAPQTLSASTAAMNNIGGTINTKA